jgi:FMN phosphatase YigB (HAD superfamily)
MSKLTPEILKFIEDNSIETISFDVFDTLVFRRLAQPSDVFEKAFTHSQLNTNSTMDSEEFKELRVYAEKYVKRQMHNGEVTLEEIYISLPFDENVKNRLKKAELGVEKTYSFVYQPMLDLILALKNSGKKVILISDMYLSQEQICEHFFSSHPILQELPLYVSSEYRLNKSTGTLFDYVAKHLDIDKKTWLHLGDNRHSDFVVAQQKSIAAKWLSAELDVEHIFRLEKTLFGQNQWFNCVRFLAATHFSPPEENIAANIGSLVWGPILHSFADWVIDQTIKTNSQCILCLMREAVVFVPLIELRIAQRGLQHISVKSLYASRKSTFWAAIDTSQSNWFDDLVYILMHRRGYNVADYYHDFFLQHDGMLTQYSHIKVKDADGVFYQGKSLLKQLTSMARKNIRTLEEHINQQRLLFCRYYQSNIKQSLAQCTVVDLGGGGTIQHQIEVILAQKSAANLLFYSFERIYRFSDQTLYSSFLNARTDTRNLRQIFARSPECIEPFLVGDCGTTLGYQNDKFGTPVLADKLDMNSAPINSFMEGVMSYFKLHHDLALEPIQVEQIVPILYRYIQLPTVKEAKLFTRVYHQDNFGSNDAYPIITQEQIEQVEKYELGNFYQEFCSSPRVKLGQIHWPQAVMTLIEEKFLIKQQGLMTMDIDTDVLGLVELILDSGWQSFSIYGAGEFFEKLLPYMQKNNLEIIDVIDRKVEMSGTFKAAGFDVISLETALKKGCGKIVISSLAFKDEIARNIYDQSIMHNTPTIEVLSL